MNRLAVPLVVACALLVAAGANAKVPPQMTVCGTSVTLPTKRSCLRLEWDNPITWQLAGSIGEPFEMRSRPRPAPFYTVAFRFRNHPEWDWSLLYVPARGALRQTTEVGMVTPGRRSVYWRTVPSSIRTAFKTLSKRLRPIPAPLRWR